MPEIIQHKTLLQMQQSFVLNIRLSQRCWSPSVPTRAPDLGLNGSWERGWGKTQPQQVRIPRHAKPISARQREHVARGTNHQFGFDPQPAQNFVAQFRLAYILAHNNRSRRPNVDDTEPPQLLGQFAGLELLMPGHVDALKKTTDAMASSVAISAHPGNAAAATIFRPDKCGYI